MFMITDTDIWVNKTLNLHFRRMIRDNVLFNTAQKDKTLRSACTWTKYPSVRAMVWESRLLRVLAALVPVMGAPFSWT